MRLSERKHKEPYNRIVVKFGGTSLADGVSILRAANSVAKKAKEGVQMAVVVSAMGRATDLLIDTVDQACGKIISSNELDDILAMGERTSARVFTAALKARGQKCCYLDPYDSDWPIITDEKFSKANPILPVCIERAKKHLQPLLEDGMIVVVPGFVGKSEAGMITTMGRGASDITALILAQALSADQVILVTDVEGIMTADPKIIRSPVRLEEISMDTLVGLADSGSKFIQKKALRYKNPEIDIKVINNSAGDLDSDGTIIHGTFLNSTVVESYPEPAMAVTIVGKEASESTQTLTEIFHEIRKAGATLLGASINHNSLILYLPMNVAGSLLDSLHSIVVKDERTIAMAVRKDLAFIKVRGVALEETPGVINGITKDLNSAGINIYGIFTITSSVLIFVDIKDKEKAVHLIEGTIRTNIN